MLAPKWFTNAKVVKIAPNLGLSGTGPFGVEIHFLMPEIPCDSGQTPVHSICLRFAGPTIQITHNFRRSFLG